MSRRARIAGPENAPTRALRAHRAQGLPLLDLARSNPAACGLRHEVSRLAAALASPPAEHTPDPLGELAARREVCAYLETLGIHAEPARTLLTSSTSEAYGLLFKLLCDPGDAVLAPVPSYPLFEQLAKLEGVRLLPYPLRYDGRWHIDIAAMQQAANSERVRAVLVVSPNNPTGNRVTQEERIALERLGLPLISDEVFAEYVLQPAPDAATSALELAPDALVFRMGGLSKSALLPQAKLAWTTVAGPPAQLEMALSCLEHLADTYLAPSAFVQAGVGTLLASAAPLRERLGKRLLQNLATLREASGGAAFDLLHVEAGWTASLRLPAIMDDEAWALALLARGLRVQPGHFYDLAATPPHVMLSLLTPEDDFARGVAELKHAVDAACA